MHGVKYCTMLAYSYMYLFTTLGAMLYLAHNHVMDGLEIHLLGFHANHIIRFTSGHANRCIDRVQDPTGGPEEPISTNISCQIESHRIEFLFSMSQLIPTTAVRGPRHVLLNWYARQGMRKKNRCDGADMSG